MENTERPLRPEEASLEKGIHLLGPQGAESCVTAIQSSPQFLGMGPTHSPLKKLKVKNKRDTKKWERSQEHVPLTLKACDNECCGPTRSDQAGVGHNFRGCEWVNTNHSPFPPFIKVGKRRGPGYSSPPKVDESTYVHVMPHVSGMSSM